MTRCSGTSRQGNGDPSLTIFGAQVTPNVSRAGFSLRLAGQPLLQRRGLRGRPQVVRRRLRHRLHRARLAFQLQQPGRAGRRCARHRLARRRDMGQLRPARPDLPLLRRGGGFHVHAERAARLRRQQGADRPRQHRVVPVPVRRGTGHAAGRHLPQRIASGGADGPVAAVHGRLAARRPHGGSEGRRVHARRRRRLQRPGARPDRRGRLPVALLEGDGHLRHRGRRPERPGPCRRPPDRGPGHLALRQARRHRQHAVHDRLDGPYDGDDSQTAAR